MTVNDIKKNYLNREVIVLLLSILGYMVKNYKFKLRRDEKTASAFINQDGTIHDFGDNFHGDIFKLLQTYHNMIFIDALLWVKNQLNIGEDKPYLDQDIREMSADNKVLAELEKAITVIEQESKNYITLKNPYYLKEALAISPLWVFMQANKKALKKFKDITTFDVKNKTICVKIHDQYGKLVSFKRRRIADKGKWITSKGTHPNGQCLYYIIDKDAPVYIVEGHHDYLTAILLNNSLKSYSVPFNVLMVPTVNYRKFNKFEINLLTGKDVYFLPDLNGDDVKGIEAFTTLAEQIENVAHNVAVVSLGIFLDEYNNGFGGAKLDLSAAVEQWKDKDSYSFVNHLLYYCDTGLKFDEKGVF